MLDRFRLDDTTAIVTGGSRNMGRVFSLALADAGANVAIVDLPQQADAAVDVAREVETRGRRAVFAPLDLRSPEDIPACVEQIVAEMGPVATLINNAGKTDDVPTSALDYGSDVLDDHYEIMVRGTFLMSQAVARHMVAMETHGSIVNIASRVGVQVQPNNLGYGVTKAAVIHMTRVMALELKPYGIRVNALGPGSIPRDQESVSDDSRTRPPHGKFLYNRRLEYDDLAGAAVYLASDASSMVTAQILIVDGGLGLVSPY